MYIHFNPSADALAFLSHTALDHCQALSVHILGLIVDQPVQFQLLNHIVSNLIFLCDGVRGDHVAIRKLPFHTGSIHIERKISFLISVSLSNGNRSYVLNFNLMPDCSAIYMGVVHSPYGAHLLENRPPLEKFRRRFLFLLLTTYTPIGMIVPYPMGYRKERDL